MPQHFFCAGREGCFGVVWYGNVENEYRARCYSEAQPWCMCAGVRSHTDPGSVHEAVRRD